MDDNGSVAPFLSKGLMQRKQRGNMKTNQSPGLIGKFGDKRSHQKYRSSYDFSLEED